MTRSRAAFLPHPADPFLLTYWLKFFNNVWGSEIDCLYIYVNSPTEKPVIDYIYRQLMSSPYRVNYQYETVQKEHGVALDRMLDIVEQDNIMLIEDDCFIFKKGVIDEQFRFVEENPQNVVGSARGSCSMEILQKAQEVWGISYEGEGDRGPNFWPNLFFSHKGVLLATDRKFGARAWHKGEVIEPLNHIVQEDIAVGDTFVSTSLQVRNMKLNIRMIPQYHGSPHDYEHSASGYNLWDGNAPWVHVGSLSSGTHGVLMDDENRPLAYRTVKPPGGKSVLGNFCNSENERLEWERRVQWWLTALQYYRAHGDGSIDDFADAYHKAIYRVIEQYSLNEGRIQQRQRIYAKLGL